MAEGQASLPEANIQQPKPQLKNITRSYCRCTKGILLCAEFYATHVIDADT